jgi:hypothetical protein
VLISPVGTAAKKTLLSHAICIKVGTYPALLSCFAFSTMKADQKVRKAVEVDVNSTTDEVLKYDLSSWYHRVELLKLRLRIEFCGCANLSLLKYF